MLFENNGTLQKWHMTNAPPEMTNMTPTKNGALQKWRTLRQNAQTLFYGIHNSVV